MTGPGRPSGSGPWAFPPPFIRPSARLPVALVGPLGGSPHKSDWDCSSSRSAWTRPSPPPALGPHPPPVGGPRAAPPCPTGPPGRTTAAPAPRAVQGRQLRAWGTPSLHVLLAAAGGAAAAFLAVVAVALLALRWQRTAER